MRRLSVLLWAPVILFSACTFALDAPSADEIPRKAAENETRIRIVRQQYTYQFHQEYHKANRDGTAGRLIHSRDCDVIFLGSNQFWKPVLIDGKPLDEKQLEKLKADMKKPLPAIRRQMRKRRTRSTPAAVMTTTWEASLTSCA